MSTELEPLVGDALVEANVIYAGLGFEPSRANDATFAMRQAAGFVTLGRVQRHDDGTLEIGGFWVAPEVRGQGLARRMVARVIAALPAGREVWCIPFLELEAFYTSFGMKRVDVDSKLPQAIRD
jgi:ribosomal protein S18 acetylase RimI-like enzyme